jgi:Zn-dependent protease
MQMQSPNPIPPPRPEAEAVAAIAPNAPKKRGWIGGAVATAIALASKWKVVFAAAKALPFAKVFLTAGTMGLSIFLYALRGGFPFAIGFVLLILIHEMGHGYAMKQAGIRASWPVFIPFFGAFISMKDAPQHPTIEARVAYAGPLAGTAGALVCAAIGLAFGSPFFLALANIGFFLNLFNLVPLGFLDGARIARVFSRGAWIVGAILLGGMFFVSPSPQLLLIGLMGLSAVFRRNDSDLDLVTPADRRTWAIRYFGLCFFLGAAIFFTQRLLHGTVGGL